MFAASESGDILNLSSIGDNISIANELFRLAKFITLHFVFSP